LKRKKTGSTQGRGQEEAVFLKADEKEEGRINSVNRLGDTSKRKIRVPRPQGREREPYSTQAPMKVRPLFLEKT